MSDIPEPVLDGWLKCLRFSSARKVVFLLIIGDLHLGWVADLSSFAADLLAEV